MSVYVDQLMNWGTSKTWRYNQSCHMFADTEAELDAMADAIGLKRSWKQLDKAGGPPHYDLTASKRALSVQHGAVECSWRELGERTRAMRRAMHEGRQ